MPSILNQPIAHLLSLLNKQASRILIGLAGLPGAGKSTITSEWVTEVNRQTQSPTMMVVGMDGFHLSKAQLQQMKDPQTAFARRGAPWTFDAIGFAKKLQQLKSSFQIQEVGWPGFEHEIGDPVENAWMIPATSRLILVEGLYVLYREDHWNLLQNCFDETWYLDTPLDLAMTRLCQRHQQAWNITEQQALQRIESNDRKNAELVLQTKEQADWWVLSDSRKETS